MKVGEHPPHFTQQVIAISPAKFVDARAIPTFGLIIVNRAVYSYWSHFRVEVGVKKEGERHAVLSAQVPHAMRRRAVMASRHTIQHIADIAHERISEGRRGYPIRLRFQLQPPRLILLQYSQKAVVRMLADSPIHLALG